MIFVHEVHQVIGSRARDFEAIYREQWLPALGSGGDGRLLWYANHAHLTCFAYQVLTIIAVPDGAAWLRLASRIHAGDLLEPTRALDERRHDVAARLLVPTPESPLRDVDLPDVPEKGDHEMTLFIEEIFQAGNGSTSPRDDEIAEPVATFAVAHPGAADERVVWRRVRSPERLLASLTDAPPRGPEPPGMEQRESRLWRLSSWSPLD